MQTPPNYKFTMDDLDDGFHRLLEQRDFHLEACRDFYVEAWNALRAKNRATEAKLDDARRSLASLQVLVRHLQQELRQRQHEQPSTPTIRPRTPMTPRRGAVPSVPGALPDTGELMFYPPPSPQAVAHLQGQQQAVRQDGRQQPGQQGQQQGQRRITPVPTSPPRRLQGAFVMTPSTPPPQISLNQCSTRSMPRPVAR